MDASGNCEFPSGMNKVSIRTHWYMNEGALISELAC